MKFLGKLLLYIRGNKNANLDFKVVKLVFQTAYLQWTSLNFTNAPTFPIFKFFRKKKGDKLLDKWRLGRQKPYVSICMIIFTAIEITSV